jgi:transposase-like protein
VANSTFPLYDQILNGRLREILIRYREQGLSLRDVAAALGTDHGIAVSHSTVARFYVDFIDKEHVA